MAKKIEYNPNETFEEALKSIEKFVIIIPEEERFDMEFKAPTGFFVINANGDAVYFRTRSRPKAQEMADRLYGVGFYTVRKELKAAVR